ncbi:phage head spike fiber domain-containing protein [Rubrobacter calidifluminis]|uniref:phage head spike fiber domain-containing protein n=1 Tax=Rubrobacter calidifluminis TaxID=1392640 RepID=UPI0023601DB4|nr:hypothetical protein [Rubrobacter calidifluminis]
MPLRHCRGALDKVQGLMENLMLDPEGAAVLSSRNLFPNPDGMETDEEGEVRFWRFGSAPQPDGWWWYIWETGDRRFQRQGTRMIDLSDDYEVVDDPPEDGGPPPDPADYAKVARPDVSGYRTRNWKRLSDGTLVNENDPRYPSAGTPDAYDVPGLVELHKLEMVGYGAGRYPVALAYIVGDPSAPPKDLLHTRSCEPYPVTIEQDGQGFKVPLPDASEVPAGVTAIGILMGRPGDSWTDMRLQKVVRVGRWIPDSVTLRGPWNKSGPKLNVENTTYRGGPGELPEPDVKRVHHAGTVVRPGAYQFWIEERTEFGYTAGGKMTGWLQIDDPLENAAIRIRPDVFSTGTLGWRCCMRYDKDGPNGNAPVVYVTNDKGKSDLERGEAAYVFTTAYMESKKEGSRLVIRDYQYPRGERHTEDKSGIPDPTIDLEGMLSDTSDGTANYELVGGAPLSPGKKRIRFTWGIEGEKTGEDTESAPSDPVTVKVPGVAGAATHTLKVFRPPGSNEVRNPAWKKLDVSGGEEHWKKDPAGPTGIQHDIHDGQAHHQDHTNKTTDEDVHQSDPIDVRGPHKVVRQRLTLEERTSGLVQAQLKWLDNLGNEIRRDVLDDIDFVGDEVIERTVGDGSTNVDIVWPANAAFLQKVIRHIGSDSVSGARNLTSRHDHHGIKSALVHNLKRWPNSPVKDEDPEDDYPPSGYCVAVDDWHNSPQKNQSYILLGPVNFETDGLDRSYWDVVGGVSLSSVKPIFGSLSLRCANLSNPGSPAYIHRSLEASGLRSRRSDVFVMKMEQLPSSGEVRVYQVRSAQDSAGIAWISVNSLGNVRANYRHGSLTMSNRILGAIRNHDELEVEIHLTGVGTANGRLRVYLAKQDNKRRLVFDQSSLDWSTFQATDVRVGLDAFTSQNATAVFKYDHITIADDGSEAWTDLPGRMFEYYGPPGTPLYNGYGFFCDHVPVQELTTYCFSFYLWYRGVNTPASPLGFTVHDAEGNVIKRVSSPADGITGRRGWHRRWVSFTTPEGAAYINFGGYGGCADGLIRVMAPQLELGDRPTSYTNENATSGSLTMAYDLRVPSIPSTSSLARYNLVSRFRRAGYIGETEGGITDITVQYASCPKMEPDDGSPPAWTPWYDSLEDVPVGEGFMIKATLTTLDATKSPELRDLFLDFIRPYGVLCRADGSEYPGGALPVDLPPAKNTPIITQTLSATNKPGVNAFGEKARLISGWGVQMFTDEGVEQFYEDLGEQVAENPAHASTVIVEDLGMRQRILIWDADFPETNRRRWVRDSVYEPGYYPLEISGLEGYVLERTTLDDGPPTLLAGSDVVTAGSDRLVGEE